MTDAPVALVTGASRGIGKATAIALAAAGFDVALAARTVHEGDARSEPNSVRGDDPAVSLPGSLESTAAEIRSRGQRALTVPMDLLIDVLFNNAIYQGRGTMDRILDMRLDDIDKVFRGNFAHQLRLIQLVVPHMTERGHGRIINMVSGSARHDPPGPAGAGGWGIGYAASKAAFGRIAGGIEAEFADRGVRAFNVDPGNVITEKRRLQHPNDDYERGFGSAPAEATGAAVSWLAGSDEALRFAGKWIYAPKLCADHGLLPGWPPEGVTP